MSVDNSISYPHMLVIKIGTSTLSDSNGSPDTAYLASLAAQIAEFARHGTSTVIVTSGAIRAGLDLLTLPHSPKSIPLKQAAAAVGQGRLMGLYANAFAAHELVVAQMLLTRDDFHVRSRYVNAANTIKALLKLGAVPVINENDSVAVEEIKVGDNDTLAALVAGLVDADLLILLSDVDGLYSADPNLDETAVLLKNIAEIDGAVEDAARSSRGDWGTGGMRTKIEAATICMRSQIPMIIANGRHQDVLRAAVCGEIGSRFEAKAQRAMPARKRWIAGGQKPSGTITVHEAACEQLIQRGKSLLPAGVLSVAGEFNAGDLVVLVNSLGSSFARGIINCPSTSLERIKGMQTSEAKLVLGADTVEEVIHRDNMVLMPSVKQGKRVLQTGRGERI